MLSKLLTGRALRYSSEFNPVQKTSVSNIAHAPKSNANNIRLSASHIPPPGYISYSTYSPPSHALLIPNSIAQKTLQNRAVVTPLVMKSYSHTNIPSIHIPISSCSQEIIPRNLLLLQNMASDVNYKLLLNNGSSQSSLQGFSQKKCSAPLINQNLKTCQNTSYNATIPPPPSYPAPSAPPTLSSYSQEEITQKNATQCSDKENSKQSGFKRVSAYGYRDMPSRSIIRQSSLAKNPAKLKNEEQHLEIATKRNESIERCDDYEQQQALEMSPRKDELIQNTKEETQDIKTIVETSLSSNASDTPTSSPTDTSTACSISSNETLHSEEEVVHEESSSNLYTDNENIIVTPQKTRYPKEKRYTDTMNPNFATKSFMAKMGITKEKKNIYKRILSLHERINRVPDPEIHSNNSINLIGKGLEKAIYNKSFLHILKNPTSPHQSVLNPFELCVATHNALTPVWTANYFMQMLHAHNNLDTLFISLISSIKTPYDSLAAYSTIIEKLHNDNLLMEKCYKISLEFDPNPSKPMLEKIVQMVQLAQQYPEAPSKPSNPTKKKRNVTFQLANNKYY